jgi:diacylglycerol O-acyltransferase
MDRLSFLDAGFLYLERPETPMNIASVTIFEPPAASLDSVFQAFRDHTVARLDVLPSYRRRVQTTPLNINHPVWANEEKPDLDYHIQRRVLAQPGSMDKLRSLIAELHAVPLDRARPLWQYYFIEGLEGGGFAIYIKTHHSAMDGGSGMATTPIVYDFSAESAPLPPSPRRNSAEKPGFVQLINSAFEDLLNQQVRLLTSGPKVAKAFFNVSRRAAKTLQLLPDAVRLPPKTLFNVSISKERSFGTASISQSLIAGVPVNLREPGDTEMNNQVGAVLCNLATDIADPLERLAAITMSSRASKDSFADVKGIWPTKLSFFGAPILASGFARLVGGTRIFDVLPSMMNVVVSNVPGPRQPMYCAGVRALHYFPVSIPYHSCALNITTQSYLDNIDFGLIACRAAIPDVQVIADYLVEEMAELTRANDAMQAIRRVEVIEITPSIIATRAGSPAVTVLATEESARRDQPVAKADNVIHAKRDVPRAPTKVTESR